MDSDPALPNELEHDAEAFGIKLHESVLRNTESGGVWACYVPALRAFLSIQSQWRIQAQGDGTSLFIGLDYTAVRAGLDLAGLTTTPALWNDLRQIESGARAELNGDRT